MKEKLLRKINNISLQRKISLIIALVNIVLFLIISSLGVKIIASNYNNLLHNSMANLLSYSVKDISEGIETLEQMSWMIVTDSSLQSNIKIWDANPDNPRIRTNVYRDINNLFQKYKEQFYFCDISYISLWAKDIEFHTDSAKIGRLSDEEISTIISQGVQAQGAPALIDNYCLDEGLFLSRAVRQVAPMNLNVMGVVTMCIDFDKLVKTQMKFSDIYGESHYILLDRETNNVIYTSNGISEKVLAKADSISEYNYKVVDINEKKYFAVADGIQEYGWKYIALVPYDDTYGAIQFAKGIFFVALIICLGLSITLSDILIHKIIRHIEALIIKMKNFDAKSPVIVSKYDYSQRTDEIGMLHTQFDSMVKQIVNYIQIDYTNKLLMKEAQLKALESQIDPHFLYNVLASINWRAKDAGESKISEMTEALSKLLRVTLNSFDEGFTLKKELELVKNYMTIQQLRFEDDLEVNIHISDGLLEVEIPKLTVLTFVENAVKYGMEDGIDRCRITLVVNNIDTKINIMVRNTGSAFEEDFINKLDKHRIDVKGTGIGLENVKKRLELTFGDNYKLDFYNEDNEAVVLLSISSDSVGE